MITEKEKAIYNSYLYASRTAQNKPVTPRRNFDKMSEDDKLYLKRLSIFFDKHRHINYDDWFKSPYKVYGADEYFDLHFFTTYKAIKCFTIHMRNREVADQDSEESIELLKKCLAFIYNYCKEKEITLEEYKCAIEGNMPLILLHLKEHKISFYTLQALEAESTIKSVETCILDFMVKDFWTIFNRTRTAYISSKVLKVKARKGIDILSKKLGS